MASDTQRPDSSGVTQLPAAPTAGDLEGPPPDDRAVPRARPGAYWVGLVVLAVGLAVTVVTLATRVTSIVQTILLAVPLVFIGIGLERVGRGTSRGSLRAVGAVLVAVTCLFAGAPRLLVEALITASSGFVVLYLLCIVSYLRSETSTGIVGALRARVAGALVRALHR